MENVNSRPALSVIVTIVDGGPVLERCLEALENQTNAPGVEVLIPYDHSTSETESLIQRHPNFTFMDLGVLSEMLPKNAYEHHELFDRRRTAGLKSANGEIIAMIEDRGWPRPDWAASIIAAHQEFDDSVIGGGVDSAAKSIAAWAIFFVDFSRYQPPFDTAHPEYVTDTNISYKRDAILGVQKLWDYKYQESEVNWAIAAKGKKLRLCPEPRTVQQRPPPGAIEMASERIQWGRIYGQVRSRGATGIARFKWSAITPLLPLALYLRHLKRQIRLKRHLREYLLASPVILYLLIFWSIGELIGYFEGGDK